MINPEEALIRKQNKEEGDLTEFEESLYLKLRNQKKTDKLDMDDFTNVYPRAKIEADKKKVTDLEKKFDKIIIKLAEIFEKSLNQEINRSGWLGDNCRAVNTTKYDDYFNHTDLIIEWQQDDGEVIRLALDASVTRDERVVMDKARKITEALKNKKGTEIEYFQSPHTEKRSKEENVPGAILAISRDKLKHFCEYIENSDSKDLQRSGVAIDILGKIYDQIEVQLEWLAEKGHANCEIYKNLEKLERKLADLLGEKVVPNLTGPAEELDFYPVSEKISEAL